jgi:RimJ/RimL family protein N-acetyltransferase
VSRSNRLAARLSTYAFPAELGVDELLIRAPTEDDLDVVAPAFADPTIGGEADLPPFDPETLRRVFRDQLPELGARGLLSAYVIADVRDGGRLLGGMSLHHLDPIRDVVEIGYWLFHEARGRGVATRAVEAATAHAFANGIYRVEEHVRVGNAASERVLERAGFRREGVKARFLRRGAGDERHDATLFARLADD